MDTLFWTSGTDLPIFHLLDEALLQVADNTVSDTPLDKVQLGYGGREALELNASRTAERIEELLGVSVKTRLVRDVDREHLAVRGRISHVLILGVVRHKPFQFSK
jgi:hypothetical protein